MQCICENISGCKPKMCGKQSCGVFRISESYWFDAGEPTVSQNEYTNSKDASDYFFCVNDRKCAETTVRAYMKRFSRDCNRDGVIDCLDYILIHLLGPTGCLTTSLSFHFFNVMELCLSHASSLEDYP
ncbi:lysozyme-like [Teleopsis dalmanni]|uniref:lysozyme-like n=1 Tax=Teleopsis dalmanni TaxID=139649 RepID=UPI0018CF69CB|nr:lysozyme-like [Teleopsis dalmanni]